jgi:DNA-binding NarL/FixJ family response regulator
MDTDARQEVPALGAGPQVARNAMPDLLLPRNPGEEMLAAEEWERVAHQLQLSAREFSVAVLIFEGNSRHQIARRLHCASGTVRIYIDRLFAKLNVPDRLGMVLRVMRVHLALAAQRDRSDLSQKDATWVAK